MKCHDGTEIIYNKPVSGIARYNGDGETKTPYDGFTVGTWYPYSAEGDDSTEAYFDGMIDTINDEGESVIANGMDFFCKPFTEIASHQMKFKWKRLSNENDNPR